MANEIPHNVEFCQFKECPNLKENGRCKRTECHYNYKWIEYWVRYGVYPPLGVT